mmetsp:Transcript_67984/g.151834  ORF Transcript_67984/g.151834 Transcript_67984/m.151834 type:complete len:385 (-) Transcript_67984:224-1378(-)
MLDRSKHRCADLGSCSECFVTSGGPLPQSTASVAIATVWDGGDSYECAIPLWCQSATAISKIIPNSELLMLTPKASAHCPHAVQMFPQTTNDAAQRYLSRYSRGGMTHGFSTANLLKFALFSLTRYELVLYADLDIDLAATMLTTETWRLHTASLLQTPALFVGLFDHASPVNGGLWLARPRCPLHRDAVRLLRHGSWSAHAGFDRIGSPHEIGANRTLMRPLLEKIASGSAASLFKVEGTLNYTQYFRWNRWDFVNGHLDQGMLWYLYFLRNPVGTWAHYVGSARGRWHADHFWGGPKPWSGASSSSSRRFWARLRDDTPPGGLDAPTRSGNECWRLKAKADRAKGGGERGAGWKSVPGPLPHVKRIHHWGTMGHAVTRLASD